MLYAYVTGMASSDVVGATWSPSRSPTWTSLSELSRSERRSLMAVAVAGPVLVTALHDRFDAQTFDHGGHAESD
jgi:hypothetical protein